MRPAKNNQDLVTSIIYISSIGTCNLVSKDLLEFFGLATLIHFQERESEDREVTPCQSCCNHNYDLNQPWLTNSVGSVTMEVAAEEEEGEVEEVAVLAMKLVALGGDEDDVSC